MASSNSPQTDASDSNFTLQKSTMKKATSLTLAAALITQLTACGTLLYPERRGQSGGKVDLAVVAMDAVGLLFFFVPGVIAFAVDFVTGAIYLQGGGFAQLTDDELKQVAPEGKVDEAALKQLLEEKTDAEFSAAHLQAVPVISHEQLNNQLALYQTIELTPTLHTAKASIPSLGVAGTANRE